MEQEWNGRVERLRKELELNAEDIYKQQDHYSMLMKEYQELRDHSSEMIRCHVKEAVNAKEKEIEIMKSKLKEKETQSIMEIEGSARKNQNISWMKPQICHLLETGILKFSSLDTQKERKLTKYPV